LIVGIGSGGNVIAVLSTISVSAFLGGSTSGAFLAAAVVLNGGISGSSATSIGVVSDTGNLLLSNLVILKSSSISSLLNLYVPS
jgi:hypothetical protein